MKDFALSRRAALGWVGRTATALTFPMIAACGRKSGNGSKTLAGPTMGTSYRVTIARPPDNVDADRLSAEIDRILETVDMRMSTYRADSELSRFNAARSQDWFAVSDDTLNVVAAALDVSRLSGGAFDVTVGPSVNLWGFGPAASRDMRPEEGLLRAPSRHATYRAIGARRSPPALRKSVAEAYIDLSGIAKGFALDKLGEHIEAAGIEDYLIEIGGELRARGRSPRGDPWTIGIEKPLPGEIIIHRRVGLADAALATSGDYRHFFLRDGRRYSHIIDPRTDAPITHDLASVSVIAETAMRADALATALAVLGPNDGPTLALRNGLAALFMVRDGNRFSEIRTPMFDRYVLT